MKFREEIGVDTILDDYEAPDVSKTLCYVIPYKGFFVRLNFRLYDNKIVKFPQLQCVVGSSRSNLVNFVKIKSSPFPCCDLFVS